MISLWPFKAGSCVREAIKKQTQDNERLCLEHQEVTARIVAKAERIANLTKTQRPLIAGRSPKVK